MFSENKKSSGKHMICDIREIRNMALLNNKSAINEILNDICKTYDYSILDTVEHEFSPHGLTILYLLSESHISIHTFPERNYFALDVYTCREYENNDTYLEIYDYLVKTFDAKKEEPLIIDRNF
jgi:S-adenosylmethionine decarboxylase